MQALPSGYTARSMTMADVPAITAMLNASSRALFGKEMFSDHDISSDWEWAGADPALNSRVIFASDGSLVAYKGLWAEDVARGYIYLWGRVHPQHTGRGLGTYLLRWAEARARQYLDQAPPEVAVILVNSGPGIDQAGMALHLAEGFQAVRHYIRMIIDFDGPTPAPEWPQGIQVRAYRVGPDDWPAMLAVHEAFADHWGFVERPLEMEMEAWQKYRLDDPLFDPALYFLAMDGEQVAGVSLCKSQADNDPLNGYVHTLGVRRPWRKRGLGKALLLHSFQELRQRGCQRASLVVDAASLTGAVRLYEGVGMRSDPARLVTRYEKMLRAARDVQPVGEPPQAELAQSAP